MLWFRLLVVVAVLSAAIVVLIPTFCPAWDVPFLGNQRRIHLGTDLKGGIDLVLVVDTEEAIAAEVRADVAYLRSKVGEGGLRGADVRKVGPTGIEIASDAEPRDVVRFVEARISSYDHDESVDRVHRFTLSERWQSIYRETATRGALEQVQQRVGEQSCVERPIVERRSDDLIFVSLPGEFECE
ncbi:MAG: hypothetical protein V4850_20615 [Myxococcota bacterium]